jgi:hypothetical protein
VDAANSRMHDRKARPTSFASPSVLSPEPPVRKKAKTSKKPTVNRNFVMPSDSELSSRASSTILPSPVQTLENVINFVENDAAFSG